MRPDRASATAVATAIIRAVHCKGDEAPLLADPYGDRLLTDSDRAQWFDRFMAMLAHPDRERVQAIPDRRRAFDTAVRLSPAYGAVVIRQRWAEDRLRASIAAGIGQYMILGAGLDTFAYRTPELAGRLRVFEIDHPASQEAKRQRMGRAALPAPRCLRLVPADLERTTLLEALTGTDYVQTAPAFVSLLGVTQYLTDAANLTLLRGIAAATAPGSELAFDYFDAAAFDPERAAHSMQRVAEERAASDEPWKGGFAVDRLAVDLKEAGFLLVEDLDAQALGALYCLGRSDGLAVAPHVHVARAVRVEEAS